jgi:hypothetical protein
MAVRAGRAAAGRESGRARSSEDSLIISRIALIACNLTVQGGDLATSLGSESRRLELLSVIGTQDLSARLDAGTLPNPDRRGWQGARCRCRLPAVNVRAGPVPPGLRPYLGHLLRGQRPAVRIGDHRSGNGA